MIVDGSQATIVCHIHNLKMSHEEKLVVGMILGDLEAAFGGQTSPSPTTGEVHNHLGMTVNNPGKTL